MNLHHQHRLDALARELTRELSTGPLLVLDSDLRIRAANQAYVDLTLREYDELLGQFVFDAFPDNPDDPQASGTSKLAASLETAMRSGHTHNMWVQRYDIRDPGSPDKFLPKVWNPSNSPLIDRDELLGVVHHVEEIPDFQRAASALTRALEAGASWSAAEVLHTLAAVHAAENAHHLERRHALVVETEQLRRAIETRDTIGQAKGMLMERFNVDATAAFNLLARLSQNTNTPVARIARELIEADHPSQGTRTV